MIPQLNSILFRIVWLHIVALSFAALAVPLASYLLLSSTANSFEHQTLRAHAASIAQYLHRSGKGWRLELPNDLKIFYARAFDGFAFSIVNEDGRPVQSSRLGGVPILKGRQAGHSITYFQENVGKAVYYGASIPETINGHKVWIETAQDLEHPDVILDDVVAGFLPGVLWFTIPIMLLVLAADVLIIRRALLPVLSASDQARKIDPTRLEVRICSPRLPTEIRPLVMAFNQVLDRLERAFRVQREFMADAAHELRTPLAVLRARTDSLCDPSSVDEIRHDVDVMARIADQLLDMANLEARSVDFGEMFDLRTVCLRVVTHLTPIAQGGGKCVHLTGTGSPVLIRGDGDLIFQAVRNLAENAIRHTPSGTTAEIHVEDNGTIRVMDEGPGICEEERDLVFRRFWRRDRSRSDGAGLGLPIASGIIRAHGGHIEIENRKPSGAIFVVKLTGIGA
jgi:signal transduction histidine kinase